MGNIREINVRECDVIREFRENFISRTFPRIRYPTLRIKMAFELFSCVHLCSILVVIYRYSLAKMVLCGMGFRRQMSRLRVRIEESISSWNEDKFKRDFHYHFSSLCTL